MENKLLIRHLEAARNELILAYNTAKNSELKDSKEAIAYQLADVSAELQFHCMDKTVYMRTGDNDDH